MVGGAYDDRILPEQWLVRIFKKLHDAMWRTGTHRRQTNSQTPDIVGVKPIHVLVGVNAFNHRFCVYMGRERKLYQNAINMGVCVQLVDVREQLILADIFWKIPGEGCDAGFFTGLTFISHIDLGSRVHTYHDDSQSGRPEAKPALTGNTFLDLLQQANSNRFAIK